MKKCIRILCLAVSAVIIAAMLAGCGGGDETIPVPSGGWSRSELMSVTYIADCRLSCPPVYADFSSKTRIPEELTVEGSGSVRKFAYYKDTILADLTYTCSGKSSDITDNSPIDSIYMEMEPGITSAQLRMNGIKMGGKKDKVIEALGEPDEWRMNGSVADYKFTDGGYMTLDFEAGVLFSVSMHGLSE